MDNIVPDSKWIYRFYDNNGKFNNFLDIDEKAINRLRDILEKINADREIKKRYQVFERAHGYYMATIKYLLELQDKGIINTDERMYLFINILDKNLQIYEVFSNNPMYDNKDIKGEEDKDKQRHMYQVNYQSNRKREKALDDILGVRDEQICEYEEIMRKNVLYRKQIIKEVNKDYTPEIVKVADKLGHFYEIDEERFEELKNIAEYLRKEIQDTNLSVLAQAILYQRDLLGIEDELEQLIVFLLIADKTFHLIDIYEEESKYQQIKIRAINELGFYAKRFIDIEKMIINKFYSNEKEADWRLLKEF